MSLPFIPYNIPVPVSTHNPSVDQPLMTTNFTNIGTYVTGNHIGFATNGSGWHSKLDFLNSRTAPGLTGFSTNITEIYPATFTAGTTSYLETYMSASDLSGVSQVNGYLPFVKCIVHFTSIGANGTIMADTGFLSANVGTIVQSQTGGNPGNKIVLTFANPLFYAAAPPSPYFIFYSYDNTIGATGGVTTTVTNTSITWTSGTTIGAGVIVSLMVI